MRILAIANHKGGVAKTATVRALGDVVAAAGVRVLMVDSDHQGSLSLSCSNYDANPCLANVYNVGGRALLPLAKVVRHVSANLDMVPASLSLAAAETEIVSRPAREFILSEALATVANAYDLVLIDCPPALGQLVINALVAADSVLIPTQPQPVDVAGVRMFLQTVDAIRSNPRLNPKLTLFGLLATFYDGRLKTHEGAVKAMTAAGWPVLPVRIPRSIRVAESAAVGQSVVTFEPGSVAAGAYQELGKQVLTWLKIKDKT